MNIEEKIKEIEDEIRETPYHKGTEHHIGKLRAKLARLRDQFLTPKKKGGGVGFAIKKEGDATIVLLGFPSVGKSTLLNKLTHAKSKVGEYEFTTLTVIPGMMKLHGAKIQILDLPGIIAEAAKGKGWGRQILSAARAADLLLILADANKLDQEEIIKIELFKAGVRLNERPPRVTVKKKPKGGIQVTSPTLTHFKRGEVVELAQEFGLKNAEIIIKEDLNSESLIDAFSANRTYLPAIFVVNKIDLVWSHQDPKDTSNVSADLPAGKAGFVQLPNHLFISAKEDLGLDQLKEAIWDKLGLIRVYLKPKAGPPDLDNPLILKKEATVLEAAQKVSQELAQNLKEAQIFGEQAVYQGQKVSLNFKLKDESMITFT